jgi:hypothetical protein
MPPTPSWYDGREAVGAFLLRFFAGLGRGSRLLVTRANCQAALAVYARDGEQFTLLALQVLTIRGGGIEAITASPSRPCSGSSRSRSGTTFGRRRLRVETAQSPGRIAL